MKEKLLLLLSSFSNPQKNAAAATLAWMAEDAGWKFDCYYDAFRTGDHFGGGPIASAEAGRAFGSTMAGHAHTESWYQLLATYECAVVRLGESCFDPWIEDLKIPVAGSGEDPFMLYLTAAERLGLSLSPKLIVLGGAGEDAYLYPLICSKRALAVHSSARPGPAQLDLLNIRTVESALCTQSENDDLRARGLPLSDTHSEYPAADMTSLSEILSKRWTEWCRGYFLGDPVVTACYLPFLCKTRRLALYGEPLKPLINDTVLRKLDSNPVIYGRMFNDEDALLVSQAGGCWQLVDPGRPPFPAAAQPVAWRNPPFDLFRHIEDSTGDDALREHAERGDILTSVVFWSGCIREIENFYRLNDHVLASGFRCGYAVTSETFAQGSQTPFGAIALPLERGGVFPLVEPLLASSGIGFSLESYVPGRQFEDHLQRATRQMNETVPSYLRPKGWWACLDTRLEPDPERPAALRGRPFGEYRAGELKEALHSAVAAHGFDYAITKAAPENIPAVQIGSLYLLAQHAGSWLGWSPFHAINGVEDIKRAEKSLFLRGGPGYITGTIDSCLWTFSLPHWERGKELKTMIDFILHGGRSGRLVNAHPYAVYRYAKYLQEQGYTTTRAPGAGKRLQWLALRGWNGMRALSRRRLNRQR
jgi:hypothetical protein